jgi:hypothetical protein
MIVLNASRVEISFVLDLPLLCSVSLLAVLVLTNVGWAGVEVLESSALRLEVSPKPYSYRVLEKSTGEVLVTQDSTVVTVNAELYPVSNVANLAHGANEITGDLVLQVAGRDALAGQSRISICESSSAAG